MEYQPRLTSNKLIQVKDGNLVLNPDLKEIYDTKVISIIGDARKGKSTFLNCLVNFLTGENKEYFKVMSSLEHCTIGMDYLSLNINKVNYLFIDCQGLNYERSSEDSKFLLFLYSISNVIIFNEMNIVGNNLFNTLQPMTLFLNNFEKLKIHNSVFYLRLADYDLDDDAGKIKEKLFSPQNDQYDNVRKSVLKLFSDIYITHTLPLERKEKQLLKENNFLGILSCEENNFRNLVENIIVKLQDLESINMNLVDLVNSINENKKIDYHKLDLYTLYTEKEINEFIVEEIYKNPILDFVSFDVINQPFSIDGMETTRLKIIEIEKELDTIKTKFDLSFLKVPANLRCLFYDKTDKIDSFLEELFKKNYQLGLTQLKPHFDKMISQVYVKYFEIDLISKEIDIEKISLERFSEDLKNLPNDFKAIEYYLNLLSSYHLENIALIERIQNKNQKMVKAFETFINKIKFNLSDELKKLTLESCCQGNFRSYLLSVNPYNLDYSKFIFEKFVSDSSLTLKSEAFYNKDFVENQKLLALTKYLKSNLEKEDLYVNTIKELLSNTWFEIKPEITHPEINFICVSLIPPSNSCVWVEMTYLKQVFMDLGAKEKEVDFYWKLILKEKLHQKIDWSLVYAFIDKWSLELSSTLFDDEPKYFTKRNIRNYLNKLI